jgi:hypothetical protein
MFNIKAVMIVFKTKNTSTTTFVLKIMCSKCTWDLADICCGRDWTCCKGVAILAIPCNKYSTDKTESKLSELHEDCIYCLTNWCPSQPSQFKVTFWGHINLYHLPWNCLSFLQKTGSEKHGQKKFYLQSQGITIPVYHPRELSNHHWF